MGQHWNHPFYCRFFCHLGYFITRWAASGHAPVSNMFEFTTAFGMMLVLAFIILYFLYRLPSLGLFTLSIALLLIAYASMFPTDISPLIPSLQSNWLYIHVTTAALGQAILAISFVAGVIFLLKHVDQTKPSKRPSGLKRLCLSWSQPSPLLQSHRHFVLQAMKRSLTGWTKVKKKA